MEQEKPKTKQEQINEWLKKYEPDCVKEYRAKQNENTKNK